MTHIEELGKLLDDFTKIFDQLNTLQQGKNAGCTSRRLAWDLHR